MLNGRKIFERHLLSSDSVAKSATQKPWVFWDCIAYIIIWVTSSAFPCTELSLSRPYEIPWLFSSWVRDRLGGSGGMLPQKMFNIRIFNLAENEFQTTKFPDFSLTFGILLQIPWLIRQTPWLSEVSFKFPNFFRFSRSVASLFVNQENLLYDCFESRYHKPSREFEDIYQEIFFVKFHEHLILWPELVQYAIPKINTLCNLCCLKTRLRLLCNKYKRHSSLNLVSQQLKLCNIFIFGMECC